jgi:hypothetical protein
MPTITVLSWPIADFDSSRSTRHADNISGLAYAANADGKQVAFYFVAKFIHESAKDRTGFGNAFPVVREIYQSLIVAYPYRGLNAAVIAAWEEARKACLAPDVDLSPAQSPPVLTESDLTGLISRSKNDFVFREG